MRSAAIRPTISVSVAIVRPKKTIDELVARADSQVYAAKTSGRDVCAGVCYVVHAKFPRNVFAFRYLPAAVRNRTALRTHAAYRTRRKPGLGLLKPDNVERNRVFA